MIKVGVTGGIGSGKTTFCKIWERLGAFVVYADDFAKQLMGSDQELIAKIKETFGEESYSEHDELNRSYLAKEAFAKGRVKELNAIVHPVLWLRIDDLALKKEKEGVKIFVKEAAILLQNGRPADLDIIVMIASEESERIQRVMKRDHTTKALILDRVHNQQDFNEVAHLADFIVVNNSTKQSLEVEAIELFNSISAEY